MTKADYEDIDLIRYLEQVLPDDSDYLYPEPDLSDAQQERFESLLGELAHEPTTQPLAPTDCEEQRQREQKSQEEAAKRYREQHLELEQLGRGSDTREGQAFIADGLFYLSREIESRLVPTVGRHSVAWGVLAATGIEPPLLAHIALSCIVNILFQESRGSGVGKYAQAEVVKVTNAIGAEIVNEVRYRSAKERDPRNLRRLENVKRRQKRRGKAGRATVAKVLKAMTSGEAESLAAQIRACTIGIALLECTVAVLPTCFEHSHDEIRNYRNEVIKRIGIVRALPEFLRWADRFNEMALQSQFRARPMLCPPLPFGRLDGSGRPLPGGFLTRPHALIRSHKQPRKNRELIGIGERAESFTDEQRELARATHERMSVAVYPAVNLLQNTAWRINPRVCEEALGAQENRMTIGSLHAGGIEPPKCPPHATPEERKQIAQQHREKEHEWYKSKDTARTLHEARELKDRRFYFAHFADHRSRFYALSSDLKYQGSDLERGLLMFDESKPLGIDGVRWLKIHIANCYDGQEKLSKKSFEERISWAEENESLILAVADDPWNCDGWWYGQHVDSPWQLLAACFEWAAYRKHGDESYLSRLPVPVDGSNNALQHIAAMTRDDKTAPLVNLTEADFPSDAYTAILHNVDKRLAAMTDNPDAAKWRGIIDRAFIKPLVMNLGYGITPDGMRTSCQLSLNSRFPDPENNPFGHSSKWAAHLRLIVDTAMDAMQEVIPKVIEFRNWLEEIAGRITKETDSPLLWISPSGFPCCVDEYVLKTVVAKSESRGKAIKVRLANSDDMDAPRNKSKSQSAFLPGLVHSYDAAMLHIVLARLRALGVKSAATVHDAFAVHASEVDRLGVILRDTFSKLHSITLPEIWESFTARTGLDLPPPPELGQLEIEGIKNARYCFS